MIAEADVSFHVELNFGCPGPGHVDFGEWVSLGRPHGWCNPSQCYGDADGQAEKIGKAYYRVGFNDVNILLEGFAKPYTGGEDWIAANFNRRWERRGFGGGWYVGFADIAILLEWFAQPDVPADCNR